MTRAERNALLALAAILLITVAWWALALWPVPGETPAWLARTRAVCFNATETGLPDASGWLLLIGEPLGMTAALFVIWRRALTGGLRRLWGGLPGRAALAAVAVLLLAGGGAAGLRVASALDRAAVAVAPGGHAERIDAPAPALGLLDQDGAPLTLDGLRGRPALVTFAFGHCETVCPMVVRDALAARARVDGSIPVVVVTLDPWRDTPARLAHIARTWGLGPGDRVLGGEPAAVEAVLDAWDVPRSRDRSTGDIDHPPLVYLLDARGRIAYGATGGADTLAGLLAGL